MKLYLPAKNLKNYEYFYRFFHSDPILEWNSIKITDSNLQFGMDMFDYSCSGNTEMKILDDTHFSLWTLDNKADFRFKFKSLILYVPEITKNASPIIIFESDNDKVESKYEKFLCNDEFSGKYLEGLCFTNSPEPRETFDGQEIDDFYYRCDFDESFMIPRHYAIRRYMDRKIFACINVQGLSYWNFKAFLRDLKDKSGHNIEVLLREWKQVTRNGDLFGDLILLSVIKIIKRRENYAKYGEKTAKIMQNMQFRYLANPTSGSDRFSPKG